VFLDIGMKVNGYEACRQIRAQPGGTDMTLVAITGWGQPEDGRRQTADGSPLPGWVSFDSATGTFTLRPSQGTAATLALPMTARDRESKVATTDMALQVASDSR